MKKFGFAVLLLVIVVSGGWYYVSHIKTVMKPDPGTIVAYTVTFERTSSRTLPFVISNVRTDQAYSPVAPYVRPGGDWTFFDCALKDDPSAKFTVGLSPDHQSSKDAFIQFDNAVIIVPDRDSGTRLTTDFGNWFHLDLPPILHPTDLEPLSVSTAVFGHNLDEHLTPGSSGPWTAENWFFGSPRENAQIYFNYDLNELVGAFSEPENPHQDTLLLDFVADGLRDGPRHTRTAATDPNLTDQGPRIFNPQGVGLSQNSDFHFIASTDSVLLTPSAGTSIFTLQLGKANSGKTIVKFDRPISGLWGTDANAERLVFSDHRNNNNPEGASRIWYIDRTVTPAQRQQIKGPWGDSPFPFPEHTVSPDARFIALRFRRVTAGLRENNATAFYDIAKSRTVTLQPKDSAAAVLGWAGEGDDIRAVLCDKPNFTNDDSCHFWSASPITGECASLTADAVPFQCLPDTSPDGMHRYVLHGKDYIDIYDKGVTEPRRFQIHEDDWHFAVPENFGWANSRYIVFYARQIMLLDTQNMKLSYANLPVRGIRSIHMNEDSKWVVMRSYDQDSPLIIARVDASGATAPTSTEPSAN